MYTQSAGKASAVGSQAQETGSCPLVVIRDEFLDAGELVVEIVEPALHLDELWVLYGVLVFLVDLIPHRLGDGKRPLSSRHSRLI